MLVDLHYPSHNRREYVEATFPTLIENTDWSLIRCLYITDDQSRDGAYEYLAAAIRDVDCHSVMLRDRYGGPVAAMNAVLDRSDAEIIAKVDSDLILPPAWLEMMVPVMEEHPELDALGTEPGFADPPQPEYVKRSYKPARWIGGQGLFRTAKLRKHRPRMNERWFGLTAVLREKMNCGWIEPSIATFNLDHLPFEPWASLAAMYVKNGYSRAWSPYPPTLSEYWAWWAPDWAPMFA